ncbi:MAG: bifunctional metallophosphatase/5'-nucleotidase [Deltaproteobacteria bacterium]
MSPALALVALAFSAAAPLADRCVEVVGTSDLHGHVAPERIVMPPPPPTGVRRRGGDPAYPASAGEGEARGGLAWFGGYLARLRAAGRPVLLVDGGDLFQGTLESNRSHGRAVIAAYDALHYDASALGNHEFDFGAEPPDRDLLAALRHRLAEATFPFLAANVVLKATGERPPWKNLAASRLVREGPLRVGIVGLSHPETPSLTLRQNVAALEFEEPVAAVIREAARLRKDGADLVVLVAHFGGACSELSGKGDESSCDPKGRIDALVHALPRGTVDVVVGGHTHQLMANWIDQVPVVEAGFGGRAFGWVTACALPAGGLDRQASVIHPPVPVLPGGAFLGAKVVRDEAVSSVLAPYLERVAAQEGRRVGPVLKAPIVRDYRALSPLGSLAAEALRRFAKADAALLNPGGLRADLPAGALTYGALFRALPFENRAVVLRVKGKTLLALLDALSQGHGYPQVAGLTLEGPPGAFTKATFEDGRPLEAERSYRLATVDFLAAGGDGLGPVMAKLPRSCVERLEGAPVLREIVLAYLERHGEALTGGRGSPPAPR